MASEAQKRATAKYQANNYEFIKVRIDYKLKMKEAELIWQEDEAGKQS